jgi:hypothetical protein
VTDILAQALRKLVMEEIRGNESHQTEQISLMRRVILQRIKKVYLIC